MAFVAAIAPFLALGSAVVGAGTQIIGGISASRQAKAQADALEKSATSVLNQTASEESRLRREGRQVLGQQRAAIGQAGIGFTGAPLDLIAQSATNLELDAANLRFRGALQAQGLQTEAAQQRASAGGKLLGGILGGVGSLVGGAVDFGASTFQPSGAGTVTRGLSAGTGRGRL